MLTDGVDEDDSEDGESCEDDEGELEVFLELSTDVNGIETALLETGCSIFMMVMVMMMLRHFYNGKLKIDNG